MKIQPILLLPDREPIKAEKIIKVKKETETINKGGKEI